MRVHDMLVDERRRAADLIAGLSPAELRRPTLCAGWTVHDVAAHLVSYLRFGQAKLYLGILCTAADLDRVNVALTRWTARRPTGALVATLRRGAGSRTTIPRSGYDPVLTDILLHDLDIRRPLGIRREMPADRLRVALDHLTSKPSPGFAMGTRLRGLHFAATDLPWEAGGGAPVRGRAEDLLLAVGGRPAGLDALTGPGVEVLRSRLVPGRAGPPPVAQRLKAVALVLLSPPPPARRRRDATGGR